MENNDPRKSGIEQTLLYFESQKEKAVHFAGIKNDNSGALSYDVFEKNGAGRSARHDE